MKIQTQKVSFATTISLDADCLDFNNKHDFLDAALEPIKNTQNVILDLSGITYVDSSGLSAILICFREINSAGGFFAITNLEPAVKNAFALVQMDKIIPIFESIDQAIQQSKHTTRRAI